MFVLVGGSPDSGDHRQLCRWELGEARSSGNQGLCEGKEKKDNNLTWTHLSPQLGIVSKGLWQTQSVCLVKVTGATQLPLSL